MYNEYVQKFQLISNRQSYYDITSQKLRRHKQPNNTKATCNVYIPIILNSIKYPVIHTQSKLMTGYFVPKRNSISQNNNNHIIYNLRKE